MVTVCGGYRWTMISTEPARAPEPAVGVFIVRDGVTLTIDDVCSGAVCVQGGGELLVQGTLRGPLTIESLGAVTVTGDIVGAVEVRVAGTLGIEPTGRVFGTVMNHGSFVNRGLRAGRVGGRDPDDRDGGTALDSTWDGTGADRVPPRAAAT
jgi:hypothetical protein